MKNKNCYEVVVFGRGGQGAKTTAEILAQAALTEGKNIQAFPEFGPERSGAPVRSFVRISEETIRTHEPIVDPDCVLVLDETLLGAIDVTYNISNKEPIIVNSPRSRVELQQELKTTGTIIPVDASRLALEIIGENRPNTVILGKFVFVTEIVKLDSVIQAFQEKYFKKIGPEKTKQNIEAIQRAYDGH